MSGVLCSICHENYKISDEVLSTYCGHIYHSHCLREWKTRSSTCPQCNIHNTNTHKVFLNIENNDEEMKTQLEQSIHERSDLEAQLTELRATLDHFTIQNTQLKSQLEALKLSLDQYILDNGELQSKLHDIESTHEVLQLQLNETIVKNGTLQRQVVHHEDMVFQLSQQFSEKENALTEVNRYVDTLAAKHEQLNDQRAVKEANSKPNELSPAKFNLLEKKIHALTQYLEAEITNSSKLALENTKLQHLHTLKPLQASPPKPVGSLKLPHQHENAGVKAATSHKQSQQHAQKPTQSANAPTKMPSEPKRPHAPKSLMGPPPSATMYGIPSLMQNVHLTQQRSSMPHSKFQAPNLFGANRSAGQAMPLRGGQKQPQPQARSTPRKCVDVDPNKKLKTIIIKGLAKDIVDQPLKEAIINLTNKLAFNMKPEDIEQAYIFNSGKDDGKKWNRHQMNSVSVVVKFYKADDATVFLSLRTMFSLMADTKHLVIEPFVVKHQPTLLEHAKTLESCGYHKVYTENGKVLAMKTAEGPTLTISSKDDVDAITKVLKIFKI